MSLTIARPIFQSDVVDGCIPSVAVEAGGGRGGEDEAVGVWGGEGHVASLPLPLGAGSRLPYRPEVMRKRFT